MYVLFRGCTTIANIPIYKTPETYSTAQKQKRFLEIFCQVRILFWEEDDDQMMSRYCASVFKYIRSTGRYIFPGLQSLQATCWTSYGIDTVISVFSSSLSTLHIIFEPGIDDAAVMHCLKNVEEQCTHLHTFSVSWTDVCTDDSNIVAALSTIAALQDLRVVSLPFQSLTLSRLLVDALIGLSCLEKLELIPAEPELEPLSFVAHLKQFSFMSEVTSESSKIDTIQELRKHHPHLKINM